MSEWMKRQVGPGAPIASIAPSATPSAAEDAEPKPPAAR